MSDYDDETGELHNLDDMDLGFANKIIKDKNGFIRGKLIEISNKTFISKEKRTKKTLEDDKTYKSFVFDFEIESTGDKPIKMNIRTGTLISPDKTHIKAKGRGKNQEEPEYNKLTEILLRLKLCTFEEIKNNNIDNLKNIRKRMHDVIINPICFKSKLIFLELENGDSLETINERTIENIPSFEFKNSQKN